MQTFYFEDFSHEWILFKVTVVIPRKNEERSNKRKDANFLQGTIISTHSRQPSPLEGLSIEDPFQFRATTHPLPLCSHSLANTVTHWHWAPHLWNPHRKWGARANHSALDQSVSWKWQDPGKLNRIFKPTITLLWLRSINRKCIWPWISCAPCNVLYFTTNIVYSRSSPITM